MSPEIFGPLMQRNPRQQEEVFEASTRGHFAIDRGQIPKMFVAKCPQPCATKFSQVLKAAIAAKLKRFPLATNRVGGAKVPCRRLKVLLHLQRSMVGSDATNNCFLLIACDFGNFTAHYSAASQALLHLQPVMPLPLDTIVAIYGIGGLELRLGRMDYVEPLSPDGIMRIFKRGIQHGRIQTKETSEFTNIFCENATSVSGRFCHFEWTSRDSLRVLGYGFDDLVFEVQGPRSVRAARVRRDDSSSDDVEYGSRRPRKRNVQERCRGRGRGRAAQPAAAPAGPAVDELPERGVLIDDDWIDGEEGEQEGLREGELEELLGALMEPSERSTLVHPSVPLDPSSPPDAGPPGDDGDDLHGADFHPEFDECVATTDDEAGSSSAGGRSGGEMQDPLAEHSDPSPKAAKAAKVVRPVPTELPDLPTIDPAHAIRDYASVCARAALDIEYVGARHERWYRENGRRSLLLGTERIVSGGSMKCTCSRHPRCFLLVYTLLENKSGVL